jgi:hypothetical protein
VRPIERIAERLYAYEAASVHTLIRIFEGDGASKKRCRIARLRHDREALRLHDVPIRLTASSPATSYSFRS